MITLVVLTVTDPRRNLVGFRRAWRQHLAAIGAVVFVAGASWWITPPLPDLDDGYIALDSAQSVVAGRDAQYGSPPLAGVTAPPYVLLIAGLLTLAIEPLAALRTASAMGLVALVASLWALGRSASFGGGRQLILVVSVLAAGPVVQQATKGVETGWAMAAGTALVAACLSNRPLSAAALAGLLPWLRPDLSPMAGLLFLCALWKQPLAVRLRAVAVAAIVFAPWPLWLHWETGGWIPQTMAAKAAFFAEACRPVAERASITAWAVFAWLFSMYPASVLAAAWVPRSSLGRLGLVASLVTASFYAAILPTGFWRNYHRYLYAIGVPWLALGLAALLRSHSREWHVALLVVNLASFWLWPTRPWSEAADREVVATWVREHVDPRAVLMVQDAGVFAVRTSNPLVDLVGLKTPASAAAHREWTWTSCGADRGKALASIARQSDARYLIVTSDWEKAFSLTSALEHGGFTLQKRREPPIGWEGNGYLVYAVEYDEPLSQNR